MNDDPFERALRRALGRKVRQGAPDRLRFRVLEVASQPAPRRGLAGAAAYLRTFALAALVLLLGVGSLLAFGNSGTTSGEKPTLVPPSLTAASPLPSSSAAAAATPSPPIDPSRFAVAAISFSGPRDGLMVGSSAPAGASGSAIIWRTIDGGTTWAKSELAYPPLTSTARVGVDLVWATAVCQQDSPLTCRSELIGSSDGGQTWRTVSAGSFASLSFVDALRGWAVAVVATSGAPTNALQSTSDGGQTWHSLPVNPCPGPWWPVGVSFVDAEDGWVACEGQGSGGLGEKAVSRTTNGGRTWSIVGSASPFSGVGGSTVGTLSEFDYLSGIAMRAGGSGLIWEAQGGLLRTTDGGRVWTLITRPDGVQPTAATAGWLVNDTEWLAVVWTGDNQGQMLTRSLDAGRTWKMMTAIPLPQ